MRGPFTPAHRGLKVNLKLMLHCQHGAINNGHVDEMMTDDFTKVARILLFSLIITAE